MSEKPPKGASPQGKAPPGRPTLSQVAASAGVSVKTASRVLNGEPNVAEATAVRVHEAAHELGYRVNSIARELRQGARSSLVGLITGDLANPFYSRLAKGVERELRRRGLQVVVASSDEDPETEQALANGLLQRRVRALLVVSTADDHGYLAEEERHGVPVVFLDRPAVGMRGDAVLLDNRGGARKAARHLLAAGHRRIAVVGDLSRLATHRERLAGFRQAMKRAGVDDWRDLVHEGAHDSESATRAVQDLMARPKPPTALFTTNNLITAGALRALAGMERRPALVGFDDLQLGDLLGVSVVDHDDEEMGRQAAHLALERIDGSTRPTQTLVIPTRVVARGSGEIPPPD